MQQRKSHVIKTRGRGTHDITDLARSFVDNCLGNRDGQLHVFVPHTSASLILCENADPDVRHDLETMFAALAPDGDPRYRHRDEGEDDMPAHLRSVLTANSLSIPIADGRLMLGTWQGLYLWEHRHAPHTRRVILTLTF